MTWSIGWMDIFLSLVVLLACAYYYISKQYTFFEKIGVKYPSPLPIVGNILQLVTLRLHLNELVFKYYKQFEGEKYFGLFFGFKPIIVLRDIELVKQVCIKDFDHFSDHFDVAGDSDPLFSNSLFALKGERWRHMRNTLSPAFTGSKMKEMLYFVDECSDKLMKYMTNNANNEKGIYEIEVKEMLSKYTTDVIASCAFGIECDTLNNPNNQFYQQSNKLTQIDPTIAILGQVMAYNPKLKKLTEVYFMDKDLEKFYQNIVMSMIKERSTTGFVRRDMIHLLMLAVSGKLVEEDKTNKLYEDIGFATVHEEIIAKHSEARAWTDDELTAQAVIFLFAGKDPIAVTLSFICYSMAMYPEAQEKLREEVNEYIRENNCMIKYNDLRNLKYMDMVVSETLRMWGPAGNLDRICVKPYTLPPSNDHTKEVTIEKGQVIWVPSFSFQRDPKYFPDPEKFDPERFSDENKGSIDMNSYLPFGIGPRSCIGNRFALMEIKVIMFHILANFEILRTSETVVPEIKPHVFNLVTKKEIILGFKKINNHLNK